MLVTRFAVVLAALLLVGCGGIQCAPCAKATSPPASCPAATPTCPPEKACAPCPPAPTPVPTVACEPASPTEQPTAETSVTLSSKETMNTKPFTLAGGDYLATFTTKGTCFDASDLMSVADGFVDEIHSGMVEGEAKGETALYGLQPGKYYLRANSGCFWTVTIGPQ